MIQGIGSIKVARGPLHAVRLVKALLEALRCAKHMLTFMSQGDPAPPETGLDPVGAWPRSDSLPGLGFYKRRFL